MDRVNLLAPVPARVLEGEPRDVRGGVLGDDLQALDHARDHLVLQAGVEILGVLAHDHQVHPGPARRDALMFRTGRKLAYSASSLRSATLMLGGP